MKIPNVVVPGVKIDMVDNLATFGAHDLAVLPLSPNASSSVAQPFVRSRRSFMRRILFLNLSICSGCRALSFRYLAHHQIPSTAVRTVRAAINFLFIRIKWIAVPMPHLVVPIAHFPGRHGIGAVKAWATHNPSAPSVFCRSVFFKALEMHQAQPMRRVASAAFWYFTDSIQLWWRHDILPHRMSHYILQNWREYNQISNNIVPCMAWIGRRIDQQDRAA